MQIKGKEMSFRILETDKIVNNHYSSKANRKERMDFRSQQRPNPIQQNREGKAPLSVDEIWGISDQTQRELLIALDLNRGELFNQIDLVLAQLDKFEDKLGSSSLAGFYDALNKFRKETKKTQSFDLTNIAKYLNSREGQTLLDFLKKNPVVNALMQGVPLDYNLLTQTFDYDDQIKGIAKEKILTNPVVTVMTGEKARTGRAKNFIRVLRFAPLVVALAAAACNAPINPEKTPTAVPPTPGGAVAATVENPTVTPETPEATATAEPTATKIEAIFELKETKADTIQVSQSFVDQLNAMMVSPTGKDESVNGDVDIYLNDILFNQDPNVVNAFMQLAEKENPALKAKLDLFYATNGQNLYPDAAILFAPRYSENPTASAVLSLRYTESNGWLLTITATSNSQMQAENGYPVGSAFDFYPDRFAVVAPNIEDGTLVYRVAMTPENIAYLTEKGIMSESVANRYPNQIMLVKLTIMEAQDLKVDPVSVPNRVLNSEAVKAEAERVLNQNKLEKIIERSTTVFAFNAADFPEYAEKYPNLGFEACLDSSITEINDTAPFEIVQYNVEDLFRFVASNLLLHCKNTNQCNANMSLDEFIATMPEQTWKVVNADTQQVEEISGLKITKIKVIFATEAMNSENLTFPLFKGQTGKEVYVSIQYNPDNPNELVVIAKYPDQIYRVLGRTNDGKNSNAVIVINDVNNVVAPIVLPHDTAPGNLMYNPYIQIGKDANGNKLPYEETAKLYQKGPGLPPAIGVYDKYLPRKK